MESERILLKWLKTPVGACIQGEIKQLIHQSIQKPKGFYLLTLGLPDTGETLKDIKIPFKWTLAETLNEPIYYDGLAHFNALPFPDKLFNYVIIAYPGLHHNDLNLLFQEIERILVPEGQLLFFDIHPYSFVGFAFNLFVKNKTGKYQFRSMTPVCREIKQNALSIQDTQNFFYRMPKQDKQALKKMRFLETLGPMMLFYPAGFYYIKAQKKNYNLIPLREKWLAPFEDDKELKLIS